MAKNVVAGVDLGNYELADVASMPDARIMAAARARQRGVFNDQILFACAMRYLEMRASETTKAKPKPVAPKGDNGL